MKINGELHKITDFQQNTSENNSNVDLNLFDFDHNGIIEGNEYDEFMHSTSDEDYEALIEAEPSPVTRLRARSARKKALEAQEIKISEEVKLPNEAIQIKEEPLKESNTADLAAQTLENANKYLGMTEGQVEQTTGRSFHDGFYCADFAHAVISETFQEDELPEWYTN